MVALRLPSSHLEATNSARVGDTLVPDRLVAWRVVSSNEIGWGADAVEIHFKITDERLSLFPDFSRTPRIIIIVIYYYFLLSIILSIILLLSIVHRREDLTSNRPGTKSPGVESFKDEKSWGRIIAELKDLGKNRPQLNFSSSGTKWPLGRKDLERRSPDTGYVMIHEKERKMSM